MIKIAADSQIPNLEPRLSELFDAKYSLQYFECDQLKPDDLKDIDALLVRSTVQVDEALCRGSQIKYVGSATAGINHLDTQYLDNQGIAWAHAPGCNAASVTHYVMAAIGELIQEGLFNVRQSVGIVGYGSIGKKLYQVLAALNIQVYAHDPFLEDPLLVGLDQILACDLITIHVPYSTAGAHPTSKMINQSHQKILKDKILINTSRGGVVSEALVLESQELIYIADVWQDEPTPSLDVINKAFGLDREATHIDWIIKKSKQQVFFYDKNQSVMPTDVGPEQFDKLKDVFRYDLTTQLRVQSGEGYIKFIEDLLNNRNNKGGFGTHDFKLYDDVGEMVKDVREKNKKFGLCRMVAGYAWPWLSNPERNEKPAKYDIKIGDCELKWNSTAMDWVNSPNAINEVGCIHTTQGYDLNYVGVIIGPELKYNSSSKDIYVNRKEYYDRNGCAGVVDEKELKRYIINIYKTLLVRGIKGTYVYVVDDNLRKYFKEFISGEQTVTHEREVVSAEPSNLDKIIEKIMVPLVGYAPCGDPVFGDENEERKIAVEKIKIKPGYEYFILHAQGDSMNLAGIQDGDLVLCRQQLKADTGDRVIVLLGDDVTIKMYDKKDGKRILLPKSKNPIHQPIIPSEGASVLGVVQEVLDEK
ncbi:DUF2075 domain-containing protein [archaeon]|nr:DUF2075 domain-containing protein [archaeon]